MRIWFKTSIAKLNHFDLAKPESEERQATASRIFSDYIESIEASLGVKVWDIQNSTGDTISVVLQDSEGVQRELSGRADFIISSRDAKVQGAAYQHALCVVEIQSKPIDADCEYQMVTYLVLIMNRFGLSHITGVLVYTDGRCRAYRASRNGTGAIYEENDTFDLYQITQILPVLFSMDL